MPYIDLPDRENLGDLSETIEAASKMMGFVPNSLVMMARKPAVSTAFVELARAVFSPDSSTVDTETKFLVGYIASSAAGCSYCSAHSAYAAYERGAPIDLIENAWEFETSSRFSEAQKAALRLARDASIVPNAVTQMHFDNLSEYFSAEEITEIVVVISLYGFLNRWNDTFATPLESGPLDFGNAHLAARNWDPTKHK